MQDGIRVDVGAIVNLDMLVIGHGHVYADGVSQALCPSIAGLRRCILHLVSCLLHPVSCIAQL